MIRLVERHEQDPLLFEEEFLGAIDAYVTVETTAGETGEGGGGGGKRAGGGEVGVEVGLIPPFAALYIFGQGMATGWGRLWWRRRCSARFVKEQGRLGRLVGTERGFCPPPWIKWPCPTPACCYP